MLISPTTNVVMDTTVVLQQSTHVVQIPGAVTKYASILMAHSIATAS